MVSPHSDLKAFLRSLREAARQGDWERVGQVVDALSTVPPPAEIQALGDYLDDLREALIVAKASRSHIAVRLKRIRAAAGFIGGTKLSAMRHDFVDSVSS